VALLRVVAIIAIIFSIVVALKVITYWHYYAISPVFRIALAIFRPDLSNCYVKIGAEIVAAFFTKLKLVGVLIGLLIFAIWAFYYL